MPSNLDRFKADLDSLILRGKDMVLRLEYNHFPERFEKILPEKAEAEIDELFHGLPIFSQDYQGWYSEAFSLIRQILPDRIDDFVRFYEKPKNRKNITYENYRIEDALQGLYVTRVNGTDVDASATIPLLNQQIAIVKAAKQRFESSLFDIEQTIQADLFDFEIEAAEHLLKHKFIRAAGALVGVVLERHLHQVCLNHKLAVKKNPTIAVLNDELKKNGVIDQPQWRQIQFLGDIRNMCDHANDEPTLEQAKDLISGTKKVTKTLY